MGTGERTLQGAASGAAIGSAIPGVGTLVGAGIGGALGYFSGGDKDRADNEFRDVDPRSFEGRGLDRQMGLRERLALEGPANVHARISRQSDFRNDQQGLFNLINQRAQGQNLATDQQFRLGAQRNLANQQALAATGGRGSAAGAARQASLGAGAGLGQLNAQAAVQRIQEQQGAQGLLGQLLGNARGQDISQSQFNAQQATQTGLENQRLREQRMLQLLNQNTQLQGLRNQSAIASEQARTSRFTSLVGGNKPTEREQVLAGIAQAGATVASS